MQNAHNVEVEKAVLSVLLDGRQKDAYGVFAELCPDLDTFWVRDHKIVALALHEVAATGIVPDAQAVAAHLATMPLQEAISKITPQEERRTPYQQRAKLTEGQFDDSALASMGGFNVIADLSAMISPGSTLRRNCEQLARFLRQRRSIVALREAQARLQAPDGSMQAETIANDTMQALSGAMGKGRQTGGVSLGAKEALARHDDAAVLRKAGQAARIASWGVEALDEACPLAPGRLVVLAALPGGGKTSLLLQAASATRRVHGGEAMRLVSWEITRPDLAGILLARDVGTHRKALDRGWMTNPQRQRYTEAMAEWERDDIQCMFSGPETRLTDITAWIRLQHRLAAGRLLLVGVDYIQRLPGTKPGRTEYDRISEISAALMDLKNQLGICILALSQFSRDTEKNATGKVRPPRASDLKGSGSLEQDADAVVILHPTGPQGDTVSVQALIVKNRGYSTVPDGLQLDFHKRAGQVFAPPLSTTPPADDSELEQTRWGKMTSTPQEGESHAFEQ